MVLFKDGSVFAFFSSPDLKTWTHLHDIDVPGCGECPDFFETAVDGDPSKKVWVWAAANGNYLVGSFDGKRFSPQTGPHRADHGKNYYAVQTYSDIPPSDGRWIQIAWMAGGQYPEMPFNQQMSFPCELRLRKHGYRSYRVFATPIREIEGLRGTPQTWKDLAIQPGGRTCLDSRA